MKILSEEDKQALRSTGAEGASAPPSPPKFSDNVHFFFEEPFKCVFFENI